MKLVVILITVLTSFQLSNSLKNNHVNCKEFKKSHSFQIDSLPQTRYVIEIAKTQWKDGTNQFACSYIIIEWGCGTSCQMYAVFNQETGNYIDSFSTSMGCEYNAKDNLIKIIKDPILGGEEYYLIIENKALIKRL
jgi:hypothetical protein